MKSICLSFQVHQPYRLRTFRFFNIGEDHQYYDDYQNRHIIRRIAERSYIPANRLLLSLIREYGKSFKVSFAISGPALEQLAQHAPEVIKGFRDLAATGCVEFLAETWAHSLASLKNKEEFTRQVTKHRDMITELFGQTPKTFVNTELIYSDHIGQDVYEMGFTSMITEGAKHILGWKSPNFVYCNTINPKLKILLRNFRLSDDITFRFSNQSWPEWPLTAEKYVNWLNELNPNEEVVNIVMNYDTLGEQHTADSGIFDFLRSLPPTVFKNSSFGFSTPSEAARKYQTVAAISVPHPISWADEEKDLTAWLGNELQDEAFGKIYSEIQRVLESGNKELIRDWERLQTSDHFYYMCTKWFSDGDVHKYFNPYPSPYEAFINYMNVLSDFLIRLDESSIDRTIAETETSTLTPSYIQPQIKSKTITIKKPKTMAKTTKPAAKAKPAAKKPAAKKAPAKKVAAKKVVKAAPKKKVVAKKAAPKKKAAPAKKAVAAKKPAVKKAAPKKK
jgi:alpha-amylase